MTATASNLCDAGRNIDFDEMVIAPDVLEREQAYRDFHRIRGWNEESPERDHDNPPTWNPSEMRGYQLYPSFTEVRQSAEGGCELCRAISNEVPRYLDESKKMHRHPFGGNRLSNSFDPEGLAVHLSCPTSAERPGAEVWVTLCWERYEDAPPSYVLAGAFSV